MKTNQPSWFCIANLGDATPEDHGGDFVLVDQRGIYTPELWHYDPDDGKLGSWRTLVLACCYEVKDQAYPAITDNKYHMDKPSWFGDAVNLRSAASTCGMDTYTLKNLLCASCPVSRAHGYIVLASNFGWDNFDEYPAKLTRKETTQRCAKLLRQASKAGTWKDGIQ